jgi:Rhamnan synthesis protein F
MNPKFNEYITKKTDLAPMQSARLAIFCHFDTDNIISDYVIHYLAELKNSACDVVFVTNSQISDEQASKIKTFVNQIIIRQNVGYDFGAYFTGYAEHRDKLSKYKNILFINDSVFGPFYPLAKVFDKMEGKNLDMWGISDAFHKHYHIQSYFWAFKTSPQVLALLDEEAKNYDFNLPKKDVVGRYEEGITAKMLKAEMKLGVLCSNAEAVDFEMNNKADETLQNLKADMVRIAKSKQSFAKKIKALFSVKTNRQYNFMVPDANAYLTGINSCWYSMIKYFACPFIKVSLLKSANNFRYHGFGYIGLLKQEHPQYDWTLIENHLNRVRKTNI